MKYNIVYKPTLDRPDLIVEATSVNLSTSGNPWLYYLYGEAEETVYVVPADDIARPPEPMLVEEDQL